MLRSTLARRVGLVMMALMTLAAPASALDMEPIWLGTPFMEGWVPERATVLRGVVVLDGWANDGRWEEAAAFWNFAILRINTDKYGSDIPAGDPTLAPLARGGRAKFHAVAQGLKRLGEITGHPELNWAPIVSSGFSRFSGPAMEIQAAFPTRALAFINGHGGGGEPAPNDAKGQLLWRQTPSIGLQCEWESIFSGGDKTQLLDSWWRRPAGNLATAGVFWRVYHDPKTFADLGILFVDHVIRARIPADWDPRKGPAQLKALKESDGWLGSHENWRVPVAAIFETDNENARIEPFAQFKGDKERASWLLNERFAWSWRGFSARYPKARIVAPGSSNLVLHQDKGPAPVGHLESGVRAGVPFTAGALSYVPDLAKLEFFADNTPLGATTEFAQGQALLGNTTNAVGRITATIAEPGIYGLMARYTTTTGKSGWTRPLPLVVWPAKQ